MILLNRTKIVWERSPTQPGKRKADKIFNYTTSYAYTITQIVVEPSTLLLKIILNTKLNSISKKLDFRVPS